MYCLTFPSSGRPGSELQSAHHGIRFAYPGAWDIRLEICGGIYSRSRREYFERQKTSEPGS